MHKKNLTNLYLKCIALLLSVVLVFLIAAVPTLSFIVTQTTSLINTFISGLTPEGNLVIRKIIEHPFGESYTLPEELQFMFWVELGAEFADQTLETSQGFKKADGNGAFSVQVKPDSTVTVRGIPAGTEVTVREIQISSGFQVKDGVDSQTVTIVAREAVVVSFVNTYTPSAVSAVNLTVDGIKNLEGRDWQDGDAYTFRLDYRFVESQSTPWEELGQQTVTYDSANPDFNRFDFTELVQSMNFDRPGTYAFRVSEVAGSIGGIAYDDAISYFDVLVGDADMDGELEIQDVTGSTNTVITEDETEHIYHVSVSFLNSYAPDGSAEVVIPIVKKLDDLSGQNKLPSGFAFELYDENGVLVKISDVTSAAGETSIKLVYDAESVGQTYTYTLKEMDYGQSNDGMFYDENEYLIQVSIIDNLDGTISAVTDVTEITFINVYDPQDTVAEISGTKHLTGRKMKEGEFTFNLYVADADFTIEQLVYTAVNDADGNFCFEELSFDRVGTYYYVIQEDASAELGGVIYDDTSYFVTVQVADENGHLTAVWSVTNIYGDDVQISFYNTYHPMGVFLELAGKKILHDMELTEGMFHFSLYETDEYYTIAGKEIHRVSNELDGTFAFPDLFYSNAGNYHYIVVEDDSQPIENITYDDTVYCLSVAVTDDGNGQLVADLTITEQGNGVDDIVFENTYTPEPTDPPTEPTDPPTEPTDPPTEPTDPPTEPPTEKPTETPEEPTETPEEPTEPPTKPTEPPTKPSEPTKPGKPSGTTPPTTGDLYSISTFVIIGSVSMILLIGLLVYGYYDERSRLIWLLQVCCKQESLCQFIDRRQDKNDDRHGKS